MAMNTNNLAHMRIWKRRKKNMISAKRRRDPEFQWDRPRAVVVELIRVHVNVFVFWLGQVCHGHEQYLENTNSAFASTTNRNFPCHGKYTWCYCRRKCFAEKNEGRGEVLGCSSAALLIEL